MDWGVWGVCADGSRSRSEVVTTEAVGAGQACPELLSESECLLHKIIKTSCFKLKK